MGRDLCSAILQRFASNLSHGRERHTSGYRVSALKLNHVQWRFLMRVSSDETVSIISGWSWTMAHTFSMGDRSGFLASHIPLPQNPGKLAWPGTTFECRGVINWSAVLCNRLRHLRDKQFDLFGRSVLPLPLHRRCCRLIQVFLQVQMVLGSSGGHSIT